MLAMSQGSQRRLLTRSPAFRCSVSRPWPPPPTGVLVPSAFLNDPLRDEVLTYASWGLAKSTNRTYSCGEKHFLNFCLMNCLISPTGHVLPASEGRLVYFASYLARTVRHSTIELYLAAVRNLHITLLRVSFFCVRFYGVFSVSRVRRKSVASW